MAEVIRMPKLSDTMEEGVVAEWHKKVGDKVEEGELLAEIETDKATMEFESFETGTLLHIGVEKGKAAPVNDILAIIGEKGEDVDEIIKSESQSESESEAESESGVDSSEEAEDSGKEEAKEEKKEESSKPAASSSTKTQTKTAKTTRVSVPQESGNGRVVASPLAKKMAEERNINLKFVQGTGDGGRIVKRDIENYQGGGGSFIGQESYSEEPVSQMRKTIGKRLAESKFSAPHFYLTISIDMDNAIAARKSINKAIEPQKVSFNDLVVKAVASALKEHPEVNASWQGDTIRYNDHVHVGVAVAVDEGLLVPVIRFADGKPLSQINEEVKEFAEKAKNKKLQPEDWEGNTFTISNLGMMGIEEFTAIINPPDACIMAVGGINEVPVVKDGQIVPGNIMKVTLSCDHRVVDGAVGAAFLKTFKEYMENPIVFMSRGNL